jgi:hypothetical protein
MQDMWLTLAPLIAGSAVVPIQIIVTILLLRSVHGRGTAVAWVAGMTTLRLLQGLVFGLLLGAKGGATASSSGGGFVVPTLLLVLAVLFYVLAVKQLLHQPDEDAPPPKWLTMAATLTPAKAFLFGFGVLAIGAKFWIFTIGATAAIGDAQLGRSGSILMFLLFVTLAECIELALIGFAYAMPTRADSVLDAFSAFLQRSNRVIVIALGLVFGTWFLIKALSGLGIL